MVRWRAINTDTKHSPRSIVFWAWIVVPVALTLLHFLRGKCDCMVRIVMRTLGIQSGVIGFPCLVCELCGLHSVFLLVGLRMSGEILIPAIDRAQASSLATNIAIFRFCEPGLSQFD